jgi:hypothetical protein
MASLTGQTISTTYDSLLKLTDNGPITTSFKEITDGLGNSSGVFLKSTGQIKLGNYTTTTSFTGTVAGYLAFTSAGEIITTAAASGGITTLNTLTASTQTFAVGTSGTDFAISSATSTHTFNLPTASGTNRGALSSTDWTTFNSKIGGSGTTNTIPKFTAGSTLGNSNITDSGTLISLGSNTTISSGALGIGSTALTGHSLRISKTITGATTSYGIYNTGVIQSDVTANAFYNRTIASTAAASFTLTSLYHYHADQTTLGAGSSVTNQYGFFADSSLIGATNNYGFRGLIASGTNRWNLYMDGTASNHLNGTTLIGTTTDNSTGAKLQVTGAITYQNTFNRQTASYTLALTDQNDIVEMNVAGANNLTVPPNSSVAFPIGTEIQVLQYGAGQTTIVAGAGVTLVSKSSQLKIANRWTGVTLVKVATNEWYVIGNLAA